MHRGSHYQVKKGRVIGVEVGLLLLFVIALGIGFWNAWRDSYTIPAGHVGLVVREKLLSGVPFMADHKFSTLPEGSHSVDNYKRSTTVYALPVGELAVPFEARLTGGIVSSTADKFKFLGDRIRNKLVDVTHVKGTLYVTVTESALLTMAQQQDATPFAPNFDQLFLEPVKKAVNDSREHREDLPRYSAEVSNVIHDDLVRLGIQQSRIEITEATAKSLVSESDGDVVTTRLLTTPVTIMPAKVSKVFRWSPFIIATVIALVGMMLVILIFVNPQALEPLGLAFEVGDVLSGVGDVVGAIDIDL